MLERQSEGVRAQIIQDAFRSFPANQGQRFFTRHYNLSFLHYVLLHFQEVGLEELSPEHDLKLFKAYFLVAEEFGQQPRPIEQALPAFDDDYFAKMIWPTMADNMEINFRVHPYHIMARGVVFLNYFQFHSDYTKYVVAYLKKHNKKTTLNYAFDIFQMLNANFESIRQNPDAFAAYSFGPAAGFETLYEQFAIDPVAYQAKYRDNKENYAGIKARPLYKLNDNNWLVLNWSFLANKLYEGLVFTIFTKIPALLRRSLLSSSSRGSNNSSVVAYYRKTSFSFFSDQSAFKGNMISYCLTVMTRSMAFGLLLPQRQ